MIIIMRQIITLLSGIKGKLQYLHSRISSIFYQLNHTLCKIPQILSNNIYVSQFFFYCLKQFNTRTFFPFSILCCFMTKRNCIIFIKTAEMVYPNHIIEFVAISQTLNPPCIPCFSVIIPIIQRISPKLSCCSKCIRRAACHTNRITRLIKLKQFWIRPRVRTVKGHINRNISNNADSIIVCILFQFAPLFHKFILLEIDKTNLFCQLLTFLFQNLWHSSFQSSFPFIPANTVQAIFNSHI